MLESEDGTVVGSIDVSKLDQIDPKTDEARAQVEALKAEVQAGQEQATRDAERLAAQQQAQAPFLYPEEPVTDEQQRDTAEAKAQRDAQAKQEADAKAKQAADAQAKQEADEKAAASRKQR